jgi:ankyrin repeat protein
LQDERCYAELGEFCLDHTTGYGSIRVPTPEEVAELIRKISKHFQTTMIIVDGLDEITNDRAYVTRLLRDLNTEDGHIKTLFASRPEVDIGYELEDFVHISIAAMSSDIRLYVASEIERRTREKRWRIRDPSLKDHIMTTLVDEADGMFRWVSCQMDYLCECNNDRDRREALKKLPPDLPSSYERILERANRSSKENQDLVKKTLHWIVYAKDPLDTEELIEALAVCDGDRSFDSTSMTTEEDILHWCSSLVRRNPSSGELELAHFTVEEFLAAIDPVKKPAFQKYRLSGDHTLLAKACLDFILCEDFDGFALPRRGNNLDAWLDESFEITNNHPFGKYSYVRWMYHVHNSKWDNIKTEVMDLFNTNNAIEFWMLCWLRAQTHSTGVEFDFDQSGAKFFEPSLLPTALHWAATFALDKACALLLEDGMSVSQQSAMGTPLFCAIVSEYAISTSFTVHDPGSDLWQEDSRKLTIRQLLDAGADLNEPVDPESKARAFAIAIRSERRSLDTAFIASMLLDAGARIFKPDFRILNLDPDNKRRTRGPLPGPPGPPRFLYPRLPHLDPIKPATTKVCGIPAESIFVSVTINSWKRLVPGTECDFFSFALNLIARGWPQETFRSFFYIKFADLFADSHGAELDCILSGDTADWQRILVDVLSKAIRISAPTAAQTSSSLQQSLYNAVDNRNVTVVSHLLSYNDDIDLSHQNEESGETLLHVAMRVRCDSAPLILHGADVLCSDYTGLTPIQLAAGNCELDEFQLFWESAIKSTSLDITHEFIRALTNAAMRDNRPVMIFLVHQLLQRKMFKVDYLLELALGLENVSLLAVLVHPDHGISSVLEKADGEEKNNCYVDGNGEMVVAVEVDGEEEESFEGSGRQGTESRKPFSALEEKPRNTAFELEALYLATNPDVSHDTFDFLFSRLYRDHPYHRYQSGNTIMHILASYDDENSREKLTYHLESELDPSILNDAGLTPLAISIQYQSITAMELLLQEGANPDFPLRNGQTALHLACELGNWIAAKCLLDYDCQTWLRDHQGRTAADIAWSKGYLDFATLVWNSRCMTSQRPRLAYVRTGRVRRRSWVRAESRSSTGSYASSDRSLVSD